MSNLKIERLSRFSGQLILNENMAAIHSTVEIACHKCKSVATLKLSTLIRPKCPVPYVCKPCRCNNGEFKNNISKLVKKRWESGIYEEDTNRRKTKEAREASSFKSKKLWADENFRGKVLKAIETTRDIQTAATKKAMAKESVKQNLIKSLKTRSSSTEYLEKLSRKSKSNWANDDYVAKMRGLFDSNNYKSAISEGVKKAWINEDYRVKMAEANAARPKVSNPQKMLYAILDSIGVKYFREHNDKPDDSECLIGPWSFDCVIPRSNKPTLLIEVQGDYYHTQPKAIKRDTQKASYIINNYSDKYELKYLWEHEFKTPGKVEELVKYWTGGNILQHEYEFSQLRIDKAPSKEYKELLSKYHYLPNAGRGGIVYGAYLDNVLIAVAVFSPLVRQNIGNNADTRELSRFCIHPSYRKKNLGTWFLSRCISRLPKKYNKIISYCDTTYNHDGALYKAANFVRIDTVRPDYWYISEDGWAMHKKTLYNHARSLCMTESDFAKSYGYTKVFGKSKIKFELER